MAHTLNHDLQLKIRELLAWAAQNGGKIHPHVEIAQLEGSGLGYRATQPIPENFTIIGSSISMSLSYLNAISAAPLSVTDPFPTEFLNGLKQDDPMIIGNFFLIQQFLKGEESHWWPYIRLLPQPSHAFLPILWPAADRRFLAGTNAEPPVQKRKGMWSVQYEKGIGLLSQSGFDTLAYTYELYKWAAAIFASRSFQPSLTIGKDVLDAAAEDYELNSSHVLRNDFSVLWPLVDIGNHNGFNRVRWMPLSREAHTFGLTHISGVAAGDQIYNYYGNKSNSELLLGYGFTLPQTTALDMDSVNIKLKPSEIELQSRRLQCCYEPPNMPQPEEGELMFEIRRKPNLDDGRLPALQVLSHGLVDMLSWMLANDRERKYMLAHRDTLCFERLPDPLGGSLSRNLVRIIFLLVGRLELDIRTVQSKVSSLGPPENANQALALSYRNAQLSVLESALPELQAVVSELNAPRLSKNQSASRFVDNARLYSLETGYNWLEESSPDLHQSLVQLIADDQDEPLPIDWAPLIAEEWDFAYWVILYYTIHQASDCRNGSSADSPLLNFIRGTARDFTDSVYWKWEGDTQEQETLLQMLSSLRASHPDTFTQPQVKGKVTDECQLLNYISHVIKEETFIAPYLFLTGSQKGEVLGQRLLYVGAGNASTNAASSGL